jgi:putative two-component system response regulator
MADIINLSRSDTITFLQKIAYMAEAKEWDNTKHIERIRQYVLILATKSGLAFPEAEALSIASILHDIGKSLLPEELQHRKGKFTSDEWKIIEQHTILGKKLLEGNGSFLLQSAEVMALSHHERWDGSGYPQRLKGTQIPYSARICALADVFDALTTARAYKAAANSQEAAKLIEGSAGKLFDPDLVSVFKASFKDIETVRQRNLATQTLPPLV